MRDFKRLADSPGNQPALVASGRRPPDRRGISARWLIGTFLTGVTSCTLMGGALFAALDGRERLTTPPLTSMSDASNTAKTDGAKNGLGDRIAFTLPQQNYDARRTVELSTMQKVGSKEVYRTQPFEMIRMALAEKRPVMKTYPKFNALTMFSDTPPIEASENAAQIVGTKLDVDMVVFNNPFPSSGFSITDVDAISDATAEMQLRSSGLNVGEGAKQVAALNYGESIQLSPFSPQFSPTQTPDVRIVQENVSIANRVGRDKDQKTYIEDIIPIPRSGKILSILNDAGYENNDATAVADVLSQINKSDVLPAGSTLRLGVESSGTNKALLIRASIYYGMRHEITVALNDNNQYIQSEEPEMTPVLKTAFEGDVPSLQLISGTLPNIYDAVYQSALAYDLSDTVIRQIIRTLANDFDLQSHISLGDSIQIFYALQDKNGNKKQSSEIRYIAATIGDTVRKYYLYQSADGMVNYYNSEGRSSKQFLLRKPVPNSVFRSPFGPRRHPILGYVRMHSGVDWAAPRGTPIIAAGDGVVTVSSFSRGYGNHTEIRHANGYVTTYSHQNSFAAGIQPGVRVKQGQIIGYVGSTGLSTGPHCHYEMIVNGTKVDPMRIRLPDAKALKGKELEAFKRERDRMDALINAQGDMKIAIAGISNEG